MKLMFKSFNFCTLKRQKLTKINCLSKLNNGKYFKIQNYFDLINEENNNLLYTKNICYKFCNKNDNKNNVDIKPHFKIKLPNPENEYSSFITETSKHRNNKDYNLEINQNVLEHLIEKDDKNFKCLESETNNLINNSKKDLTNTKLKEIDINSNKIINNNDNLQLLNSNTIDQHKKIEIFKEAFENALEPKTDPSNPNYLLELNNLTREEQRIEYYKHMLKDKKEEEKAQKYRNWIIIGGFIFFIGLYSLWVPLYRAVCEHGGFVLSTKAADYKDYNDKDNAFIKESDMQKTSYKIILAIYKIFSYINPLTYFDSKSRIEYYKRIKKNKEILTGIKYEVNFFDEVNEDLPWEFVALQKTVHVNPGETCLAFYKVKNKSDKPIIGLSVYDIHPNRMSLYFNKVQCFCFQNQILGPYEEVDLPVLFFIDPAVQDDSQVKKYGYYQLNLKYTFYLAANQNLALVMEKHLKEEAENEKKLKERKMKLNEIYGYKKYNIEDINGISNSQYERELNEKLKEDNKNNIEEVGENESKHNILFPGINPLLNEYYTNNNKSIDK